MRPALLCLILLIVTAGPGCQSTGAYVNRTVAKASQSWSAEKAWRCRKNMYADVPCRRSFKAGFKAGFRFAHGGYDSCEPPIPQHFWRINGVSDDERANAQAWSDGFTHGSLAAQQDGAASQSALDTAAAQRPEGVPDVNYIVPPPSPYGMETPNGLPIAPERMSLGPNGMPIAPGQTLPEPYGTMVAPNGIPQYEEGLSSPNVVPPQPTPPGAEMPQASSQGVWLIPSSMPAQTVGPEAIPFLQSLSPGVAAQPAPPQSYATPKSGIANSTAPNNATEGNATAVQNPTPQPNPTLSPNGANLSIRPATSVARRPGIGSLRTAGRPAPVNRDSKPDSLSESQSNSNVAPAAQSPSVELPTMQPADWQLPIIRD